MSCCCTVCTGSIDGGEDSVCPTCIGEINQVKEWTCPRGRPSKNKYHPDLNEWVVEGPIPKDKSVGLTGLDNVLPARFTQPWSALGKKRKPKASSSSSGGIYDGYISSLLVSLHFQTQNDKLYLQDMRTQENFLTQSLFHAEPGTKVLNPFRVKLWDNEKFFDGQLSDKLKGIFGASFKLTYGGSFRDKSEQFCQLIVNQVKHQENHPRIVKYFGSFWTSNTIRNFIGPEFDGYLKQFKELLQTIVGSSLNNCFSITPPNKKQKHKAVKTHASSDYPGAQQILPLPLGDLSDDPVALSNVFDSPPKKAKSWPHVKVKDTHVVDMMNKLYRDIFVDRTLSFIDTDFQSIVIKQFEKFESESMDVGTIARQLMTYVMKENIEVSKFVKNYMCNKNQEIEGIFDCVDFAQTFTQTFLKDSIN